MQSEREHERVTLILQDRPATIKALCRAAKAGDLAEVKQWLELDPSLVNDSYFSYVPLVWALDAPHPETFLYLLSQGADENTRYKGHTLAERVALYCQWQSIEKETALQALAEKGVVLNPFLLAAWRGDTEALSREALLLEDRHHNNVTHYASANGQVLLLQQLHAAEPVLIIHGNNEGMTPLLFAAANGQLATVQWLLHGTKTEFTMRGVLNEAQSMMLRAAADHGPMTAGHFLTLVPLLVKAKKGAQITEQDNRRNTALKLAAQYKHTNVVNWLIGEFGVDPGDGRMIAMQLHSHSPMAKLDKKAAELRDLFIAYYLRQQPNANKRLLQAALPNFPNVLRGIIAEYAQYPQSSEQKPALPVAILLQNDDLLRELRAHAKSRNFFLPWRGLARELITTIEAQQPYHALTIHLAVSDFLAAHANQIAGSRLSIILKAILDKTAYFKLPEVETSPERGQEEAAKPAAASPLSCWSYISSCFRRLTPGSTIAPADGKPQHARRLPPQGPLSPPPPSSPTSKETAENTARTTRLIQWLTRLPDPRLRSVNWQPSREGQAIAYFDHEAQAQDVMALLRSQQPELILQSSSQASSGSPAIRYALSVAAPDGITLAFPALAAANDVPVSPSALSSASAFFAQDEASSVPPAKREKKTHADAEQTTASTRRNSLHTNPLLEEEKDPRNSL